MRKYGLWSILLFVPVTPTGAQAQTVEECMAVIKQVQAFIDSQEDQGRYAEASAVLERAEFAAGKGQGKECMENAVDAKGSAESLGRD